MFWTIALGSAPIVSASQRNAMAMASATCPSARSSASVNGLAWRPSAPTVRAEPRRNPEERMPVRPAAPTMRRIVNPPATIPHRDGVSSRASTPIAWMSRSAAMARANVVTTAPNPSRCTAPVSGRNTRTAHSALVDTAMCPMTRSRVSPAARASPRPQRYAMRMTNAIPAPRRSGSYVPIKSWGGTATPACTVPMPRARARPPAMSNSRRRSSAISEITKIRTVSHASARMRTTPINDGYRWPATSEMAAARSQTHTPSIALMHSTTPKTLTALANFGPCHLLIFELDVGEKHGADPGVQRDRALFAEEAQANVVASAADSGKIVRAFLVEVRGDGENAGSKWHLTCYLVDKLAVAHRWYGR